MQIAALSILISLAATIHCIHHCHSAGRIHSFLRIPGQTSSYHPDPDPLLYPDSCRGSPALSHALPERPPRDVRSPVHTRRYDPRTDLTDHSDHYRTRSLLPSAESTGISATRLSRWVRQESRPSSRLSGKRVWRSSVRWSLASAGRSLKSVLP